LAFVGLDHRSGRASVVGRALTVSAVLTVGFVVVFGAFGLLVTPLALRIEQYLPWATIVIGVGLVGLGIALLVGRQLILKIPKLDRGGSDATLPSMFLFGVSYAVASLSCTIGPFLAVTTSTFRTQNWITGVAVFVAYGLGMGVIIATLTVAVALAKTGVVRRFRNLLPVMNKIAGGLLMIAGGYVAYYGWYEIRVLAGADADPIIDRAIELQTWLQNSVVPDDPSTFAIRAVIILAIVAIAAGVIRRRHTSPTPADRPTHTATIHDDQTTMSAVGLRGPTQP
jgi:cytochrome c biogenesis protein CcdA